MVRLLLCLSFFVLAGCAGQLRSRPAASIDANPEILRGEIETLQDQVDILSQQLHRERLNLVEADRSVAGDNKTNSMDNSGLILTLESLKRQQKALEAESQAMDHVIHSPF